MKIFNAPIFTPLRKAYGGGFRAGMAEPRIVIPGGKRGVKVIVPPPCPYKLTRQFLLRWIWEDGYHDGLTKRLTLPVMEKECEVQELYAMVRDLVLAREDGQWFTFECHVQRRGDDVFIGNPSLTFERLKAASRYFNGGTQ